MACSAADPGVTATRSRQDDGGGLITEDTTIDEPTYEIIPGVIDFGDSKESKPYDAYLTATMADLAEFWAKAFPEAYGIPWIPLSGGVWAAYSSRQEPLPGGCNGVAVTPYEMVEQNAFAALELSDRAYVLEPGRATLSGTGAALLDNPHVQQAYLGA